MCVCVFSFMGAWGWTILVLLTCSWIQSMKTCSDSNDIKQNPSHHALPLTKHPTNKSKNIKHINKSQSQQYPYIIYSPKSFDPSSWSPQKKTSSALELGSTSGTLLKMPMPGSAQIDLGGPGPGGSPGSPSLSRLLTNSICCGKWCYYIYIYIKIT